MTGSSAHTAGTQATTPIPAGASASGGRIMLGRITAAAGQPMSEPIDRAGDSSLDADAANTEGVSDIRRRVAYAIAQADGDMPGMDPDSWDFHLADAVIDLLIDMAGQGELLKAIDRMYR